MYFASDSRVSWGKNTSWDHGQKVVASRVEPEIFGFTGYVTLPQTIIAKAVQQIDLRLRSANDQASIDGRVDWLYERIKKVAEEHPAIDPIEDGNFTIFYGVRIGQGMPGRSTFCLNTFAWDARSTCLKHASIPMPSRSAVLQISGTGSPWLNEKNEIWRNSDQGNTSRTMFSAFCDALKAGNDPYSGGEPQLVGIYRKGPGRVFGIVTEKGASFQGELNMELSTAAEIEWRDTLFQRVDAEGRVLKKAQRHARPAGV